MMTRLRAGNEGQDYAALANGTPGAQGIERKRKRGPSQRGPSDTVMGKNITYDRTEPLRNTTSSPARNRVGLPTPENLSPDLCQNRLPGSSSVNNGLGVGDHPIDRSSENARSKSSRTTEGPNTITDGLCDGDDLMQESAATFDTIFSKQYRSTTTPLKTTTNPPILTSFAPLPDTSTMPLQEADSAIREHTNTICTAFKHAFEQEIDGLTISAASIMQRAEEESTEVKNLIRQQETGIINKEIQLEQVGLTLKTAEADIQDVKVKCADYAELRQRAEPRTIEDSIRQMIQKELEKHEKKLETATKAADAARVRKRSHEDDIKGIRWKLKDLQQQLAVAEKTHDRLKVTLKDLREDPARLCSDSMRS